MRPPFYKRKVPPAPQEPTGVRIEHLDGSVTPCEIYYYGRDEDDNHLWIVTTKLAPNIGDRLAIDMLPPNTAVKMDMRGE